MSSDSKRVPVWLDSSRPVDVFNGCESRRWTPEDIRAHYDRHPDLQLLQFSRMTGLSVKQLKRVLMG
jgi:hypothetical protein